MKSFFGLMFFCGIFTILGIPVVYLIDLIRFNVENEISSVILFLILLIIWVGTSYKLSKFFLAELLAKLKL